jgi:hypothetical protein
MSAIWRVDAWPAIRVCLPGEGSLPANAETSLKSAPADLHPKPGRSFNIQCAPIQGDVPRWMYRYSPQALSGVFGYRACYCQSASVSPSLARSDIAVSNQRPSAWCLRNLPPPVPPADRQQACKVTLAPMKSSSQPLLLGTALEVGSHDGIIMQVHGPQFRRRDLPAGRRAPRKFL